ncbi:SH3 domain-containing protein [uncultured Shimia sp.]|uniref:SH3 domain-containing protein n=1 Tax=uncultured Shimia sp. TaxID=573152 RepID=UPI002610BD1A|nr:SH3 domain-containing protein [uncultured Shimia sp.]
MKKFILLSLIFMGWAFYELSGGKNFVPEEPARIAKHKAQQAKRAKAAEQEQRTLKAARAQKLQGQEDTRAAVQLASLDLSTTEAVLTEAAFVETPPLARRQNLFSTPTPTPEVYRTRIGPEPSSEPQNPAVQPVEKPDLRTVKAKRVNMRGGPGTSYSVLAKLERGDQVVVLREPDNGWVKLRVVDGGRVGWMSAKLLTKVE